MHGMELAQSSAVCKLDCQDEIGDVSPLSSCLIDASVAGDVVGQAAAFGDGQRARFLAIHVLARPGCDDRCLGVPPVARGDQARIDVIAGEHLKHVPVRFAVRIPIVGVYHLLDGRPTFRTHVGHSHELDSGLFEKDSQVITAPRRCRGRPSQSVRWAAPVRPGQGPLGTNDGVIRIAPAPTAVFRNRRRLKHWFLAGMMGAPPSVDRQM